MKPFNLEAALAGAKLVTRDGREVMGFKKATPSSNDYPYTANIAFNLFTYTPEGLYAQGQISPEDLFLADEEVKPLYRWPAVKGQHIAVNCESSNDWIDVRRVLGLKIGEDFNPHFPYLSLATELSPKGSREYYQDIDFKLISATEFLTDNPPLNLTKFVGKWLKCTEGDNDELRTGYWYRVTSNGNDIRAIGDNGGQYNILHTPCLFDLENPSDVDPSNDLTGKWVKCVGSWRAPYYGEMTFIAEQWYYVQNKTPDCYRLKVIPSDLVTVECTDKRFDWSNPSAVDLTGRTMTSHNPDLYAPYGTQNILDEAKALIYGERAAAYGPVSASFARIAAMWTIVLGHDVTPEQVGLMLVTMKVCRQVHKPQHDNLVDIAGYVGCIDKLGKGE